MFNALTQFMSLELDPNAEKEVKNTTGRMLRGIASFASRGSSLFRTVFSVLLIKDFYNTAKAALGGLLNLISPSRIMGEVKEWADQTAAIRKTATATRLTTDEVQEYQFVAQQAGLTTTRLTDSIGLLNTKFDKSQGRSKTLTFALQKLGLNIRDLESKSASVRFDTILEALAKIDDRGQRDDLGRKIFGSNFAEMNVLLDDATKNVTKLRALARSSGAIMSEEEVKQAEKFNKAVGFLSAQWERFKNIAKGRMVKRLTEFIEYLIKYIDDNRDVLEDFVAFWFDLSIILNVWIAVMKFGLGVLQHIINLIRKFKNDAGLLKLVIIGLTANVLYWAAANNGQLIPSLIAMVRNLLPRLIPLLKRAAIQMLVLAKRTALLALKFIAIAAAGIIAFVIIEQFVRFLQGKDNLLSDALGFDKAEKDFKRFVGYFLGAVGILFGALLFLFGLPVALAGVIVFAWGVAFKELKDGWTLIVNATKDAHESMMNTVEGFVQGVMDWFVGLYDDLVDITSDAISDMLDIFFGLWRAIVEIFGKIKKEIVSILGDAKDIGDDVMKIFKFFGGDGPGGGGPLPQTPLQLAGAFGPGVTVPGIDRAAQQANNNTSKTVTNQIDASTKIDKIVNPDPKAVVDEIEQRQSKKRGAMARRINDEYDGVNL